VAQVLEPCDPVLIYLRNTDVEATPQNVCSMCGEAWTKATIAQDTGSPYGLRLDLTGFEGEVT
jgi:hypothetical protein